MEEGRVGFFQEALRGLMRCLGLNSGAEKDASPVEEESPPPQPPLIDDPTPPTTYEPVVDDPSTTDPLVEALTSSIEKPVEQSTRDIGGGEGEISNFSLVTIDEIMNPSGATTGEAHFVDLVDTGALLNTRLISSGGGGKSH